jgi:AcrR family transcriptional regulator
MLLLTAERLYAERGVEGVSFREVGMAAGQRNNTAVRYYFEDRGSLLEAIHYHRSGRLNLRRLELLADLEKAGQLGDIGSLLDALIRPHAESILDPDDNYVRFLARVVDDGYLETEGLRAAVDSHMTAYDRIGALIKSKLPSLDEAVFAQRFRRVLVWGIHTLAEQADLIPMLVGALRA